MATCTYSSYEFFTSLNTISINSCPSNLAQKHNFKLITYLAAQIYTRCYKSHNFLISSYLWPTSQVSLGNNYLIHFISFFFFFNIKYKKITSIWILNHGRSQTHTHIHELLISNTIAIILEHAESITHKKTQYTPLYSHKTWDIFFFWENQRHIFTPTLIIFLFTSLTIKSYNPFPKSFRDYNKTTSNLLIFPTQSRHIYTQNTWISLSFKYQFNQTLRTKIKELKTVKMRAKHHHLITPTATATIAIQPQRFVSLHHTLIKSRERVR